MDLNILTEFDVVPDWRENRKAPEPVTFHCRAISTQRRQRLLKPAQVGENLRMEIDMAGLFSASVVSIDNLRVNNETVKDASRFLELPGLDELLYKVVMEIQEKLGPGDLKNSV